MKHIVLLVMLSLLLVFFLKIEVNADMKYPYIASSEKKMRIEKGRKEVLVGMTIEQVKKKIGDPDEIHNLYDKKKSKKRVGYTYWFILQRKVESGSVNEKQEKLVRISFNLDGIVTKVDSW